MTADGANTLSPFERRTNIVLVDVITLTLTLTLILTLTLPLTLTLIKEPDAAATSYTAQKESFRPRSPVLETLSP